jgi:hypothetical protein
MENAYARNIGRKLLDQVGIAPQYVLRRRTDPSKSLAVLYTSQHTGRSVPWSIGRAPLLGR